jgi:hypothetical protein
MASLKTKNWEAWEDRTPGPQGSTLHVTGSVETSNSNQKAQLTEAEPQGFNPTILILNLSLASSGSGSTVMGWKEARFAKTIKVGQYSNVEIRSDGDTVASCKVEVAR